MTIKQKILIKIKKSIFLSSENELHIRNIINSLSDLELIDLYKKLSKEDEVIREFIDNTIITKQDAQKVEVLIKKTNKVMYAEEEKADRKERAPENLLKNI